MNRRRISALVLALALVLSFGSFPAKAAEVSVFSVTFSKGALSGGVIEAAVTVSHMGSDEKVLASLGYYKADGSLAGFCAEAIELSPHPMSPSVKLATATLSLTLPDELENGDGVRVIVMSASSLKPYTANGETSVYYEEYIPVETGYKGIYERYYTISGEDGSLAMSGSNLTVASVGTLFRLKDMAEGYVAFADATSTGEKRRLYSSEGAVGRRLYGAGGTSMLWRLEEADGGYCISHYDGGYLSIKDGAVALSQEPYKFTLTLAKESPFTLVTSLAGYELLSEAQKTRICEICTSVGAGIFPDGTNRDTLLDTIEAGFEEIYGSAASLSAQQQKQKILEAVYTPVKYNSGETNELNSVQINNLPGGDATVTQSAPTKEKIYIWDIGEAEYNRIDVTYKTETTTHNVKVYYNESGESNVQNAIAAFGRFPYEYRKYISQLNIYVPESSYTYNCGADGIITVRVSANTGVETMARNIAHELGHSVDYNANGTPMNNSTHWCQGAKWQQCIEDDLASVSVYGNSNFYEGFAEFARLYFQCYGNRDRQIGIKQLYPNRFASFGRMLDKIGMAHLYD